MIDIGPQERATAPEFPAARLACGQPPENSRLDGSFSGGCRGRNPQQFRGVSRRYPQVTHRPKVNAMSKRYRALQRCTIVLVDNVVDNILAIRDTAPHPYARVSLRSINHIDFIFIVIGGHASHGSTTLGPAVLDRSLTTTGRALRALPTCDRSHSNKRQLRRKEGRL